MPFPLRFPLAFKGKLLGEVLRTFTDPVARWYRNARLIAACRTVTPVRPCA